MKSILTLLVSLSLLLPLKASEELFLEAKLVNLSGTNLVSSGAVNIPLLVSSDAALAKKLLEAEGTSIVPFPVLRLREGNETVQEKKDDSGFGTLARATLHEASDESVRTVEFKFESITSGKTSGSMDTRSIETTLSSSPEMTFVSITSESEAWIIKLTRKPLIKLVEPTS